MREDYIQISLVSFLYNKDEIYYVEILTCDHLYFNRLYWKHVFNFLKINMLAKSKNRFPIKSNVIICM